MKLSGWKRKAGAVGMAPFAIISIVKQFTDIDLGEAEKWITMFGIATTALYGVGWLDKVLPFTQKLEKVLELFNSWAAKRIENQSGMTVKGVVTETVKVGAVFLVTAAGVSKFESVDDQNLIQAERDKARIEVVVAEEAYTITAKTVDEKIERDTVKVPAVLNNQRTIPAIMLDSLLPVGVTTGTTIFIVQISMSDEVLGIKDSTIIIRSVMPPIGVSPVWKDIYSEVAHEKIPAVCEKIGVAAAEVQGWYPILNSNDARMGWSKVKGEKYVEPVAEPVAEEVEVVK